MIGFMEHFFTVTINYSAIANLHNSLGRAPFSSLYSQLLPACLSLSLILRPTVSRRVYLGIKHPSGAYDQIFYYCQTVAGLLMWGAISDERTGVSFTIAVDPRQRSHFRVQVTWDS
jgi:hypothetical protein